MQHVVLLLLAAVLSSCESSTKDYCVIGAGPAGIQLGYYLHHANADYVVFERSNTSGNFFVTYPRHGQLISINKRNTGKTNDDFNMRHDWNSLLSDDINMRFTRYTKKFFPKKELLVDYLNDFTNKYKLHVQFNTTIEKITASNVKDEAMQLVDSNKNLYKCRAVIVATGWTKENKPTFHGADLTVPYSQVSTNPDDFEGKSVLIIGRGNSAFETADNILGSTNVVHMLGRSRLRLSWETHYVGDLRAVNNGLLDTYQLKSLDGLAEAPSPFISLSRMADGRVRLNTSLSAEPEFDNYAMREGYDVVVACLGFKFDFDIFNRSGPHPRPHKTFAKFPLIKPNYESEDVDGLFFAGTVSHSIDFRKSSGGFIHGFRYTARALFNLLQWRYHRVQWPATTVKWVDLMNTVTKRINEAAGTYQMFGILGDIIMIDDEKQEAVLMEEFPVKLLGELRKHSGRTATRLIVMLFEYGKNYSGPGKDVFQQNRAVGEPSEAHLSNFLHPVFYYYSTPPTEAEILDVKAPEYLPRPDRIHHMVEDFLTQFDGPVSHILPLRRFIEASLGTDLRLRFMDECFELTLTSENIPADCLRFLANHGVDASHMSILTK